MPSKKYPFLDEKQLGLVYETQRNHYRKNKDEIIRKNKERRDRYTKEKRYECELCKKAFGSKYRLDQHMNTKKHNPEKRVDINKIEYSCKPCNFNAHYNNMYKRHLKTSKHAKRTQVKNTE